MNIESIKKEIYRQVKFFNKKGFHPTKIIMTKEIYNILKPILSDAMKVFGINIELTKLFPHKLRVHFNGTYSFLGFSKWWIEFLESIPDEFKEE